MIACLPIYMPGYKPHCSQATCLRSTQLSEHCVVGGEGKPTEALQHPPYRPFDLHGVRRAMLSDMDFQSE